MNNSTRNYGIDLLRMVAMFMVIILHMFGHGGLLGAEEVSLINYVFIGGLEVAAFCAVNCYALVSGYVGVCSRFKLTNIVMLWFQVLTYTVGITVLFAVFKPDVVGTYEWISMFFPVSTQQYWYFTSYCCMFFFIPIVNVAMERLPKHIIQYTVMVFVVLFSVLPTVLSRDIFQIGSGYSGWWLLILYVIGAYIRKYGFLDKCTKLQLFGIYVFCVVLTGLYKCVVPNLPEVGIVTFLHENQLLNYTSPTILLAGVSLLVLFSKLNVNAVACKMIGFLSPAAFGVYLIHDNNLVRRNIMSQRLVDLAYLPTWKLMLVVIGIALAIYIVCSLIDLVRGYIFKAIGIKKLIIRMEEAIRRK